MQEQSQLWPEDVQTYAAFEHYAGLVQSRAFHMLTENWITGAAQEGIHVSMLAKALLRLSSQLATVLSRGFRGVGILLGEQLGWSWPTPSLACVWQRITCHVCTRMENLLIASEQRTCKLAAAMRHE